MLRSGQTRAILEIELIRFGGVGCEREGSRMISKVWDLCYFVNGFH